jgi:hypothetical protein
VKETREKLELFNQIELNLYWIFMVLVGKTK